nr:hypothetical protein [Tanacetum cinerariifolium]
MTLSALRSPNLQEKQQAKSAEEYKAQQNVKVLKSTCCIRMLISLLKEKNQMLKKFADDMVLSQEDPSTMIDLGSYKESLEAKKVADYVFVDEEVEEETAEATLIRRKKNASKLLSSLSKSKSDRSRDFRWSIARMSRRQGYMLQHMKKSFMPRNMKDNLPQVVVEGIRLEREKTKADIASMVINDVEGYTEEIVHDFEQRLERIFGRQVNRVHILDFEVLTHDMRDEMGLDVAGTLCFQLGGVRRSMTWRQFILAQSLHTAEEMVENGFGAYWLGSERVIPDKGDLSDY